jgi:2-polyprenyl-3-methyl-5-hydroxy-6-metoxy-1,4-benzoquinol methylase
MKVTYPPLDFWQFRLIGQEQWQVQPNKGRRAFVRICGPLGVNARIRNARVINTIHRLGLNPGAKVLDVGCGHGYGLFWLARLYPDCQFTGLEFDAQHVEEGQRITQELGLSNLQFVQSSALEIEANAEYDLIYSMDVLEHIEDDIGTLHNIRRALKDDGDLILHLPRRHQEAWTFLPAFKAYTTPDHVRDEYTPPEIREKLQQTGFEVQYFAYGYSKWGELAFESNYLFWNSTVLRTLTAIVLHPLSVWLGYRDIREDHDEGNAFIIHAVPVLTKGGEA